MRILYFAILGAVCGLAGCSAVNSSISEPIIPQGNITGNWEMTATSTVSGAATRFSIYLTATNGTVSGILLPQEGCPSWGCGCPFPGGTVSLAGTVDAQGNISMQSTAGSLALTVTGLVASGTMAGSYTISAGCSQNPESSSPFTGTDMGNIAGTELPALNGTYNGTVTSTKTGATMTVTATLMQASAPNTAGALPVTGTVSFSGGQSCLTSLSVQSSGSYLYGTDLLTGLAATPTAQETAGFGGTLSADGKTLSVTYGVSPLVCNYDSGNGTLTLQ